MMRFLLASVLDTISGQSVPDGGTPEWRPACRMHAMGATIAEKILGAHAGGPTARAGEVVVAAVDFAMMHDARAGNALKMVEKLGGVALPFARQTALVLDHYSPPPHPEAANTHRAMRAFAERHGAVLYDVGDGICHQVLPEGGHFTCGDVVVGTDTHSTTYGA